MLHAGVRIVNTCDESLIDETALADALMEGQVLAAALDVYTTELLYRAASMRTNIANPLTLTVAIWVQATAVKHPVPDWVKPSFVIFDIRAL